MSKVTLNFVEISERLKKLALPAVECVVGIATGGIVPAAMVAHQLGKPLHFFHINYRAEDNSPRHDRPILLADSLSFDHPQHILLVDDVAVSGATLMRAQQELSEHRITTLVMKGTADFILFPEVSACVNWPWQRANG